MWYNKTVERETTKDERKVSKMKMWVMSFREDGNTNIKNEYYSNEDAANARADYLNKCGFISAWVRETIILDVPREGAPDGYFMWDGVPVK